jgi:nickel transport protein
VNVFAYVEGDTVVTDSYFSDGRKCQESTIEVFDEQGKKLLEGKTDADGRFSFRPPARMNLLIRLTSSMGHRAEYKVPAGDLPESVHMSVKSAAPEKSSEKIAPRPQRLPEKLLPGQAETMSAEQLVEKALPAPSATDIEQAIDKALARQLEPIRRALEESQRRQRFSDIAGGIGYIVGLMGLAAYFHSRKRREQG